MNTDTEPEPKLDGSEKLQPRRSTYGWLRELLWMAPQVEEAREKRFDPSKPGYVWFDIASRIGDDLIKFGEVGRGTWSILMLACASLGLLVRAHLARAGFRTNMGPLVEVDWEYARKLPPIAKAWNDLTVTQAEGLVALLGPQQDATIIAGFPEKERQAFVMAVLRLVALLSRSLEREKNRLVRALFARWLRVVVAGLVVCTPFVLLGNWIDTKLGPPNLALHCPVTTSSQHSSEGLNRALLVDGDRTNLGFHTDKNGQQWVVIDLGKVRRFDKVVVYNRANCCQERAVPLQLEVSKNNKDYTLLAEQKDIFDKWQAKRLHAEGRYIRLKNAPNNYLHLAEVEVY